MREYPNLQAPLSKLLKKDVFGRTGVVETGHVPLLCRDAGAAAWPLRWIARRLLAAEARALAALDGIEGIPVLIRTDRKVLLRQYIEGVPMQEGKPADIAYFNAAARVLRQMHRAGIVHNDLAKEPNFLVTPHGAPAIIDFQLSWFAPRRGRVFRLLAREDIRHLLKHKRTYCPQHLTAREKQILQSPSHPAKLWMMTGKPVYLFITRRLLGWEDREGAGDRV